MKVGIEEMTREAQDEIVKDIIIYLKDNIEQRNKDVNCSCPSEYINAEIIDKIKYKFLSIKE